MSEDTYPHYEEAKKLLQSIWEESGAARPREPGIEADPVRRLLVDTVYHFSHSITEERPEKGKNIELHIEPLIRALRFLDRASGHDRTLLVRAREIYFTGQRAAPTSDYSISFGSTVLDLKGAAALAGRSGTSDSTLRTRLSIAFERLARYQIQSLYIEIPRELPEELDRFRLSMRILTAFHQALQSKVPVYFPEGPFDRQVMVITDRNNQPNPNLTLLGALNHLNSERVRTFFNRFEDWVANPRNSGLAPGIQGIYGSLYALRAMLRKLRMPPFEINSTHRLALNRIEETICPEKARIIRLVEETVGDDLRKGACLLEAIFAGDEDRIDARTLAGRLLQMSDLVDAAETDGLRPETLNELRTRIGRQLRGIRHDVFARLEITEKGIRVGGTPGESGPGISRQAIEGPLSPSLLEWVRFHQDNAATRNKIKGLAATGPAVFAESDLRNIAAEFEIDRSGAERLLLLTGECFDAAGRFRFDAFADRIEDFTRFGRFVFVFFWEYVGETPIKEDRPAFLSAIQYLVFRLEQPREVALKLISDLCGHPDAIRVADRNALMLLSLLVRTQNRALRIETEMTPEEVLVTGEGLNPELIDAVRRRIETQRMSLFQKIGTLNRVTRDLLDDQNPVSPTCPPLPFMLAVQREVLIFLGLIGGETALSLIRAAAAELGDPDAGIHHLKKSPAARPHLLSLLQTAIRGLGRQRRDEDIPLLRQIHSRSAVFEAFNRADARYVERVQRVMNWVEKVIGEMEDQTGTEEHPS